MTFQGVTFALLGAPGGSYDLELSQDAGHYFLQLIRHGDHGALRVFVGPSEAIQLSNVEPAPASGGWAHLFAKA